MTDARTVAGRWLAAFNAHDEAALAAVTAPDATMTAPPELDLRGVEAVTAYAMAWLTAFPDARIRPHRWAVEEDVAVMEFTFAGTHTQTLRGPGGDISATGAPLLGRGIQVLRIEDDRVAEAQLYFDQVQVLTQLGLMPELATV